MLELAVSFHLMMDKNNSHAVADRFRVIVIFVVN